MIKKSEQRLWIDFLEAIYMPEDKEECYTFFEDVCTINELLSLSQRLRLPRCDVREPILIFLRRPELPQQRWSRVNRSLNYGNDEL